MEHMAASLDDEAFAAMFSPEWLARTTQWRTEDGWLVEYTTSRVRHGSLDGLFACFVYEPYGRGSRSGKPQQWKRAKTERCDTRREAKQRALMHYYEHSPKAAARHGWNGTSYEGRA